MSNCFFAEMKPDIYGELEDRDREREGEKGREIDRQKKRGRLMKVIGERERERKAIE